MPRLTKVRYDLLYKHLKAHAPEIRFLGEDFPAQPRDVDRSDFAADDHRRDDGAAVVDCERHTQYSILPDVSGVAAARLMGLTLGHKACGVVNPKALIFFNLKER